MKRNSRSFAALRMTPSLLRITAFAIALFSAAPAARFGSPLLAQDIGLQVGTAVSNARVETLEGKPVELSQYVGKAPVLIEFWATWCGNCKELEPSMKALHDKYGKRVQFLGVAVSFNQSAERVKLYVEKHGLPWTQLYDRKGDASMAYDAPATSYVVVLDKAGKVVYTGLGGKQSLEPALRKALGE
jgi:thiol-disulfide isomerase/thioredoxin